MRQQSLRVWSIRRTDWSIERIGNRIMLFLVQVLEDSLAELELLRVRLASVLPAFGGLQDRSSISRRRNLTLGAVDRIRVLALWSTTCSRRASNGPRFLYELRRLDLEVRSHLLWGQVQEMLTSSGPGMFFNALLKASSTFLPIWVMTWSGPLNDKQFLNTSRTSAMNSSTVLYGG